MHFGFLGGGVAWPHPSHTSCISLFGLSFKAKQALTQKCWAKNWSKYTTLIRFLRIKKLQGHTRAIISQNHWNGFKILMVNVPAKNWFAPGTVLVLWLSIRWEALSQSFLIIEQKFGNAMVWSRPPICMSEWNRNLFKKYSATQVHGWNYEMEFSFSQINFYREKMRDGFFF